MASALELRLKTANLVYSSASILAELPIAFCYTCSSLFFVV